MRTRRDVRRRGGAAGIAVSLVLFVIGWVVRLLMGGIVGGGAGFVAMFMAFPLMPVLGIPAADGSSRTLLAVAGSLALWWVVGQVVAGRVTQRAVAGWREWTREFLVVGSGLWAGALGALLLAVVVMGLL